MRHRKAGYKLGRTSAHREATLRNLAVALFEHGQITTTIPKAKALQPFAERLITLAKRGDIHARRLVTSKLGSDRRAFAWLYLAKDASEAERAIVERQAEAARHYFEIPDSDQVQRNRYGELRKAPRIVKHLFENIAPQYKDRDGGYTRIIRLGQRRIGDAGEICLIQLVGREDGPEIGGNLSQRRRTADRRTEYFESISKGWQRKTESAVAASTTATGEPDSGDGASSGSEQQ